jgi:hypothetical protein
MRCPRLHRPNSMNGPRPNAPTIWDSYALPDAWRSQPIEESAAAPSSETQSGRKVENSQEGLGSGNTAGTFSTVLFMGPRSYSRIVPFWMPAESAHSGESTPHSLEVWSQESRNLNFFWDADLGLQVQTAFCSKMAKDGFAHVPSWQASMTAHCQNLCWQCKSPLEP